jgi:hypothetical protein
MEITRKKVLMNFVSNLSETVKDRLRGKSEIKINEVEMQTIEESMQLIESMSDRMYIHEEQVNATDMALQIDLFMSKNIGKQLVIITDHHLLVKDEGDVQKSINAVSKTLIKKKEQYGALSFLLCQLHPKNSETEDSSGRKIPPDLRRDIKYPGDLYMDARTVQSFEYYNKLYDLLGELI